jgi:hypothetical protein
MEIEVISGAEANANPDLRRVDGHGVAFKRGKCPAFQLGDLGAMRRASSHSSAMGSGLLQSSDCSHKVIGRSVANLRSRGQMPGRVTGDPQHWRDRAAQMRALALTMKDPEIIILMTDLAADYEKLGDRAAAKTAKLPSGRGRSSADDGNLSR